MSRVSNPTFGITTMPTYSVHLYTLVAAASMCTFPKYDAKGMGEHRIKITIILLLCADPILL